MMGGGRLKSVRCPGLTLRVFMASGQATGAVRLGDAVGRREAA